MEHDVKERILNETIRLIEKSGNQPQNLNFREICSNLKISLGLINYHFKSKSGLVNACVCKMVDDIVSSFESIRDQTTNLPPYEKLKKLSAMTLDYLFLNRNLSKLSICLDFENPSPLDNTEHTFSAYLPLVRLCKPNLDEMQTRMLAYQLIFTMQGIFIRAEIIKQDLKIDLFDKRQRDAFHEQMLQSIMK